MASDAPADAAIAIRDLRHRYGDHEALAGVSLDIAAGEAFALLGPNGSGKTTLFRTLSTLLPIQSGSIAVLGRDVASRPAAVRSILGVVFQSPSLDKKLRVEENLRCYARLYGIPSNEIALRVGAELERFGVADRRRDFVETLSGGLARRVELAQTMLSSPRVLLLDEPSTGLDPTARAELWRALGEARAAGVTVVVTTHLLGEADRADRIAILDRGRLAAIGRPDELRAEVGGDTITLRADDAPALAEAIRGRFGGDPLVVDDAVRIETEGAAALAADLYGAFRDRVAEVSIGKPTLEDVFIDRTGRRFDSAD